MQKQKILFLFFVLSGIKNSFAQTDSVIIDYINTYKEIAISEMKRTGVPAAIKLAQGIHETEAGTSTLVKISNNHFGIKCKADWTGMTVRHTDDAPRECFRKYESPLDSYKDHSDFLIKSTRYASLFSLDPTDYSGWAYGLKKAGYATNRKYPQIIIKLIEDYHLQDYTMIALGKLTGNEESLVKQDQLKPDKETGDKIPEIIFSEKPIVLPSEPEIIIRAKKTSKKETQSQQTELLNDKIKIDETPVYPEGEFKINATKVIYVKKETSFLSIAEKYGLSLARIFEFNEMKEQEIADRDQLIYLMRKRKTGMNEVHKVKEGETLNDIAQQEALRLESLLDYNYLKPDMRPAVGSVLYLRSKAPSMPTLVLSK